MSNLTSTSTTDAAQPDSRTRRESLTTLAGGLAAGALSLGLARAAQAQAPAQTAPAQTAPAQTAPAQTGMGMAAMAEAPRTGALAGIAISPSDAALMAPLARLVGVQSALFAEAAPNALGERNRMLMAQMGATKASQSAALAGAGPIAQAVTLPREIVSPIGAAWLGYTLAELAIGAMLELQTSVSSSALRTALALMVGDEARHAALLRSMSGFDPAPRYFESPIALDEVETIVARYYGPAPMNVSPTPGAAPMPTG